MFGKKTNNNISSPEESMLKGVKWHASLSAILLILLGGVLLFQPQIVSGICRLIGSLLCLAGVVDIAIYFISDVRKNYGNNKLIIGIGLIVAGVFVLVAYKLIMHIVPLILGIFIIVDGVIKLQTAFNAAKVNDVNHKPIMAIAILTIIAGVLIVAFYSHIINLALRIVGLVMIFSGVTDFVNILYVGKKISDYIKDMEKLVK